MQLLIVSEYLTSYGRCPFREWLEKLDRVIAVRVQARILRFEQGNLGDYKSIGNGVYEARLDFGPGYRLYFGKESTTLILLLCGGCKLTQNQDIHRAKVLWKNYLESKNV